MKNKLLKRILYVSITSLLVSIVAFIVQKNTYSLNTSNSIYGISIGNDGTMYINNSYFKAMGLNGFDFVICEVGAGNNISRYSGYELGTYEEYFDKLSEYNIPFVRVTFGSWWPDLYGVYDKSSNHQEYFKYADKIVKAAEEHNVGIVVDFLWNRESYFYYNGEQRADMGNENSKTVQNAKSFVTTIINRYKDSPAIWGYEIGNEYNLGVDLYRPNDPPRFTITKDGLGTVEKDYYTTNELAVFYTSIAEAIHEADPTRFITTGDAAVRDGSYGLYNQTKDIYFSNHTSWSENFAFNGVESYKDMIKILNPKPIDTISLHYYGSYLTNGHLGDAGDFSDYLKIYTDTAKETNKGVYLGEFGGHNMNQNEFDSELTDISNSDVQLSSVWLAGSDGKIFNEENKDIEEHVLQKIKEYNSKYQNVVDTAWNNWKKNITITINNANYTITKSNSYTSNETSSYYLYGDKIKLNISPNENYNITDITIKTVSGKILSVSNNEFTMPDEDIHITVTMSYNQPKTYTVNYEANGGNSTPNSQTKAEGESVTLADAITREGYEFVSWKDSSGNTYPAGSIYTENINTTMTAQWKAKTYTITYNGNGGIYNDSMLYTDKTTYDSNYTVLSNEKIFVREGYTFTNWNEKANGTGAVRKELSSWKWTTESNLTLYAQWKANTYKIDYKLNGGLISGNPTTGTYNSEITINNPTKKITIVGNGNKTDALISDNVTIEQEFTGWTSSTINTSTAYYDNTAWTDGNTKVTATEFKNLTTTADATVTLIANWEPLEITLPTVTKKGYNCNWNTKSDGTGTSYKSGELVKGLSESNSSVNLYAICEIIHVTEEDIENPPVTGNILIYFVWIIGAASLGYSVYYFTKKRHIL